MKSIATIILCVIFCFNSYAQNGTLEEKSFVHNDSLRTYLMYVPAAYNGEEAWSLVVNYHGFRTDPTFQINFSQMNAAADTMNFLVAYPQGLIVSGMLGAGAGWAIPNVQSENDDVSFSNVLIDRVIEEYNVDLNRIHLTGWSQGSAMSYYLACSAPGRIASVAGVAGQMPVLVQDTCEPGRSISTMHFHGTLDPIVPFEGIPGVWPPPPETPAFWAENNNCASDSVVTELDDISASDSTTVTRIEYTDCDNDSEVVFYRINDGGHPWPGSTPVPGFEFLGHTNQDINATAEILAFFSRNPKSTVSTYTEEEYLPSELSLSVYPNPFSEQFTVEFNAQAAGNVQLDIYNLLGQKVHTILDQTIFYRTSTNTMGYIKYAFASRNVFLAITSPG